MYRCLYIPPTSHEVDLETMRPAAVLNLLDLDENAPQVQTTAHFAFSRDRCFAFFHQSRLRRAHEGVVACGESTLVQLDTVTGEMRRWALAAPLGTCLHESEGLQNFHSAFYFEDSGVRHVGLLGTALAFESIDADPDQKHPVRLLPMPEIWVVALDDTRSELQAELLPGLESLDRIALSHLAVDNSEDGFVLFANCKHVDVSMVTHGDNIYGEPPEQVLEHYAGMIVEAINHGTVLRYEYRNRRMVSLVRREVAYDYGKASAGHTWLPINLELTADRKHLFASFAGFRPRLLSDRIQQAYASLALPTEYCAYVPPLIMRLDTKTLEPSFGKEHMKYAEPIAFTLVGDEEDNYLCTFSPENGVRIYAADDLSRTTCQAQSAELIGWGETHFRGEPAHAEFARR